MVVKNNMSALNTLNTLNKNHTALANSLQTVSSGMRINSARDDASGYAISERMRVQLRSLNQDNLNTQNGHSMMKVAEGAVSSTVEILKTLKEKVINAANDTNTDSDRAQIQKELDQSIDQINDNANVTYNGKYLVDGSKNGKSDGTYTALTNSLLHESTAGGTALINLKDRNGNSLNIQTTDSVTVSYVQDGKTYSTTFGITAATTIATLVNKAERIAPGQTFADDTNDSIEAILGPSSNAALIQQANDAISEANAVLSAANAADIALDSIASFLSSNSGLAVFATGFNNWRGNSEALPNPSTFTATYDSYGTQLPMSTWLASTPSTSSYWNTYTNSTSASPPPIGSYAKVGDLIANNTSNLRAALGVSSISVASKADAEAYVTAAQAALDSIGGACILNGPKIGQNYYGNVISTSDQGSALTITAHGKGVEGQIAGFTVSVTDTNGNIKKSVNAVLDAWNETIRAENASEQDNALILHTGTRANQAIKVRLTDMRAQALGLQGKDGNTLNVSNQKNANAAINVLDNALQKALDQQTTIGSIESRLDYTSTNLTTAAENVTASESTIRDADMAMAMTEYTKNNILLQASQAMLAQANQNNNQVLSLLR